MYKLNLINIERDVHPPRLHNFQYEFTTVKLLFFYYNLSNHENFVNKRSKFKFIRDS